MGGLRFYGGHAHHSQRASVPSGQLQKAVDGGAAPMTGRARVMGARPRSWKPSQTSGIAGAPAARAPEPRQCIYKQHDT